MRRVTCSILALFILVGCGSIDMERVNDISSDAQHIGEITKRDKSNNSILVEELINNSGQPLSSIWITINNETVILNSEEIVIEFADLKTGQLVEVWNNGIILESHPGRTKAVKIKLIP